MKISFTLSMPNNNSWNGKWSGEDRKFVRVKDFGKTKKGIGRAETILAGRAYSYNFGDGWRASVAVAEVDNATARKLTKQSAGFCGYDWMIDSIIYNGKITTEKGVAA